MDSEIISNMYPFYIGTNPPVGYVNLGSQLYILEKNQTSTFAKLNPLSTDPYVRLDDTSSYGVSTDYVMEITGTNFDTSYVTKYRDEFNGYRAPFGRLVPPYTGKLSSVLYFDRTGLNNDVNIEDEVLREPGKPKYLNLSLSSQKIFLILPSKSVQFCCKNNNLGDECGRGSKGLNSKNDRCLTLARGICNRNNPNDFFGQFCQREYCKTDSMSVKPGNCDADYTALCNIKKDLNVSGEDYPYYKKYPDYCACFMGRDFLVPMCTDYASKLGISRNIKAQNALGLNVNDPNQCNKSCKINPLCRLGAQIPYDMTRGDNPVVLGSVFPDECKEIDLCVQDVTVNQSGSNIGKLTINQTANCKTILQKVCAYSTFSPCTGASISGNTYTYKKYLLEDKDQGACADPGTAFVCAEFNVSEIPNVSCNKSKEKITYNLLNTYTNGFEPDVLAAATHLKDNLLDRIKPSYITTFKESKLTFNPVNNIVSGELECKNCLVGYKGGDCTLVPNNRKWTQYVSLTDILTPSKNGGESCKIDNTLIPVDCPLNKDCSITPATNDTSCINGIFNYNYTINSFNSGEGKSCSDVLLSALPQEVKNKNPSISVDYNNFKIKASINCNDCVVDYVEKEGPEGKCHLKDGKYVITKVGKLIKDKSLGGSCPPEKLNLINTTKDVPCKFDQDCKFIPDPINDECNDIEGIRTIQYMRDTEKSGSGRDCISVGEQLTKNYDNVSGVDYTDGIYSIVSSCDIRNDCKVELSKEECKNGVRNDVYDIILESSGRGKTCEEVVREIVNDTNLSVKKEGRIVKVEGACPNIKEVERQNDIKRFGIISIIVFTLIILFVTFFL